MLLLQEYVVGKEGTYAAGWLGKKIGPGYVPEKTPKTTWVPVLWQGSEVPVWVKSSSVRVADAGKVLDILMGVSNPSVFRDSAPTPGVVQDVDAVEIVI